MDGSKTYSGLLIMVHSPYVSVVAVRASSCAVQTTQQSLDLPCSRQASRSSCLHVSVVKRPSALPASRPPSPCCVRQVSDCLPYFLAKIPENRCDVNVFQTVVGNIVRNVAENEAELEAYWSQSSELLENGDESEGNDRRRAYL